MGTATQLNTRELFHDYGLNEQSYGRPLDQRRVEKIAREFSWAALQPPVVSKRGNGRYAVVDGNHRIAAIRKLFGETNILCILHTGKTVEEEAEMYLHYNRDRARQTAYEVYVAEIVAGEPEATGIKKILDKHDTVVFDHRLDIGMKRATHVVDGLRRAYRAGVLDRTIHVLVQAWEGNPEFLNSRTIGSVAEFCRLYPKADDGRLIQVMRKRTPANLHALITGSLDMSLGGKGLGRIGAKVLLVWYNTNLSRNAIIPENV